MPEVFIRLNSNHYGDIDTDGVFETTNPKNKRIIDSKYTLQNTYGCSCLQILALKPGKDTGEIKYGCTKGTMDNFINKKGWAKKLSI